MEYILETLAAGALALIALGAVVGIVSMAYRTRAPWWEWIIVAGFVVGVPALVAEIWIHRPALNHHYE